MSSWIQCGRSNTTSATAQLLSCVDASELSDVVADLNNVYLASGNNIYAVPIPAACAASEMSPASACASTSSLSGLTGAQALIEGAAADGDVYRLALDDANGYVYFSERASRTVRKVPVGGGPATVVVDADAAGGTPLGVALRADADLLLWSVLDVDDSDGEGGADVELDQVYSSTLDGLDATQRFVYTAPSNAGWSIDGIVMAAHGDDTEAVWVENRPTEEALQKVDIAADGSWGPAQKIHSGIAAGSDLYIAVDAPRDVVAWSSAVESIVRTASLDGADGYGLLQLPDGTHARGVHFATGLGELPACAAGVTGNGSVFSGGDDDGETGSAASATAVVSGTLGALMAALAAAAAA